MSGRFGGTLVEEPNEPRFGGTLVEEPNFFDINPQQMPIYKPEWRNGYQVLPKYAPPWAHNNPELWNIVNNVKSNVAPWLSTGALAFGSIAGGAGGPPGAVAGGALGYGGAEALNAQIDVWLGNRPDPSLGEAVKESVKNVGEGAMLEMGGQAVAPAVKGAWKYTGGPLLNAGKSIIEPWDLLWMKGGKERIIGRHLLEAAGDKYNAIIKALRKNKRYVEGSEPTPAQLAAKSGSTEFAGIAKIAEGQVPTQQLARSAEQAAARTKALREIGGTADDLVQAKQLRSKEVAPLYKAASKSKVPVDVTKTIDLIDRIVTKNPARTQLVNTLKQIKKGLFDSSGGLRQSTDEIKSASQNIKDLLDAKNPETGKAINEVIRRELTLLKRSLDNQIGKAAPEYREAQKVYADLSKPVDKMKLGQHYGNLLNPPKSDLGANVVAAKQTSNALAKALREDVKTVKKATKFAQPSSKVLTPKETKVVSGVGKDLTRNENYEALAGKGLKEAGRIMGDIDPIQLPNALIRPIMMVNALLKRVMGKAEGKTLKRMGEVLQDRELTLKLLEAAREEELMAMEMIVTKFGELSTTGRMISAGASQIYED